jgi:hypothetical protein
MTKFNDEMQKLIQKAKSGGQVTLSDLEKLERSRPNRGVSSAKSALKKAMDGRELNKSELDLLAKDPDCAVAYAKHTVKRFPECEDHLLKSKFDGLIIRYFDELFPHVNKKYEDWLVHGEYENNIVNYCSDVLKARWKEGEEVILKASRWNRSNLWSDYHRLVVKGRWLELERRLFYDKKVKKEGDIITNYFMNLGHLGLGRHEDLEARLLKSGTSLMLYRYALHCVGGKLPDSLHNKMLLVGKKWTKRYLKGLKARRKMTESFLASLNDEERREILRPSLPDRKGQIGTI